MRRIPGLVVAVLCVVAMLPGLVQAAGLTSADTNGDGKISRAEADAAQDKAFKRLDTDGDGSLDMKEFAVGQPALPDHADARDKRQRRRVIASWFNNIDSNGNGKISKSEYRDAVTPYFDHLDTNGDGAIEASELQSAFEGPNKPGGSGR